MPKDPPMNAFSERAKELDRNDPLASCRERFVIPEGVIYLDGNSLGLMASVVPDRLAHLTESEWSQGLIRSWSTAGWFDLPLTVGNRIAPIIGAGTDEVAVGESTSVNLFRCMAAAMLQNAPRSTLLVESENFPTDNYLAESVAAMMPAVSVRDFSDDLESSLDDDVAVVVLSHIDYRSSKVRDMAATTAAIHAAGALVVWDVSHSAGAVPLDVTKADVDFAVGCTYKYLNGGPGAPAFTWVNPRHTGDLRQPLTGWMGHRDPFAFAPEYEPAPGARQLVCGTPQVVSLTTLDASLELWADLDLDALYAKGRALTEFFIEAVEATCPAGSLTLAGPRNPDDRGGHVSFDIAEGGLHIMQALYERGVVGDFRPPSLMRFGFAPLYTSFTEVAQAAGHLADLLSTGAWRDVAVERVPGT